MKTNKKRIAISILTVFMMVFSVIPYMGAKADVAYAASTSVEAAKDKELGTVTVLKGDYTKKEYFVGEIYLDQSVNTLTFYGVPGTLVIRDSAGNKVVSGKEFFYDDDVDQYFTKAGKYKVYAETVSTSGIRDAVSTVTYTLTVDINYTYKYASLTATATENGMENKPAVKIEYGAFDGPTGSVTDKLAIFRESNGKIRKLDISYYSGQVDTIKINYGTQYTYYIVDLSYVTGTAYTTLSNVGTVDETLTDAIKTALTDSHVVKSNTVTTKSIVVSSVENLQVYKKGVRTVSLDWGCSNGFDEFLTGYIMESYNSAGKKVASRTIARTGFISGESIYIPYEGTSKIKVTPYEDYNGTILYGESQTINVTSAKLTAPGANVTKLSNTKASITANRSGDAKGIQIQQKKGTKWVVVASAATTKEVKKTWTKNNAGKTSYRMREYLVDKNGKTYYSAWKTFSPKANQKTYTKWAISSLETYTTHWYPIKIWYSGNTLKVTGRFYNTGIAQRTCKVKITFNVDGKKITKTMSAKIGGGGFKDVTYTLGTHSVKKDVYRTSYSRTYLQRH